MYCTYITSHPTGFFYIGKSQSILVQGGYKGSGVRLHCAFMEEGFERETWTTKILNEFETEAEAFENEAELCPLSLLQSPWCLNDTPGGRTMFRGSAHRRILRGVASKKRKAAAKLRKEKAAAQNKKKKEVFAMKLLKKRTTSNAVGTSRGTRL